MNPHPALAILDGIGGPELVLILVVVLIFFGGEKMPEFARGLGKIMREFRKATSEVESEIKRAMEEVPKPAKPYIPPVPAATPEMQSPGAPAALAQPADSPHPGESDTLPKPPPDAPAHEEKAPTPPHHRFDPGDHGIDA